MQQIISFLIHYKNLLLYVLLMTIALAFTVKSHSYHHSKFFNSSNYISGSIYQSSNNISSYFGLDEENKKLLEENKKLRSLLFNQKTKNIIAIDTSSLSYKISIAQVIKNSYIAPQNYITLSVGQNQGIQQDMGVITSKGILGIVESTSPKFTIVQSILNTKSTINAKIKNTNYFGSLVWNTKKHDVVQLVDVSRRVSLKVGDTIVTGAMSSIFPENIPIGTIKKVNLNTSKSFYNIDITLFNDMTNIKNVYIINHLNKREIQQLEMETNNVK
ncbi:MAG: rod shape-determining protein MreC [Cellulophaga sp.]